jgi:hypothetical protein
MYYVLSFLAGVAACLAACWVAFVIFVERYVEPLMAIDKPSMGATAKQSLLFSGEAISVFISETIDDLRVRPIEATKLITVATYFGSMVYFGVPIWRAILITTILAIAMLYHFGVRRIQQLAVLLLLFTMMSWAGWIPSPEKLRDASYVISDRIGGARP